MSLLERFQVHQDKTHIVMVVPPTPHLHQPLNCHSNPLTDLIQHILHQIPPWSAAIPRSQYLRYILCIVLVP